MTPDASFVISCWWDAGSNTSTTPFILNSPTQRSDNPSLNSHSIHIHTNTTDYIISSSQHSAGNDCYMKETFLQTGYQQLNQKPSPFHHPPIMNHLLTGTLSYFPIGMLLPSMHTSFEKTTQWVSDPHSPSPSFPFACPFHPFAHLSLPAPFPCPWSDVRGVTTTKVFNFYTAVGELSTFWDTYNLILFANSADKLPTRFITIITDVLIY